MKLKYFTFLGALSLSFLAYAEKASVKLTDVSTVEDTTISIRKGDKAHQCSKYEIIDGNAPIEGTSDLSIKQARTLWNEECAKWKTEFRDNWRKEFGEANRDNQIISLSCGSAKSEKDQMGHHIFKSTATYKIRAKTKSEDRAS